MSNSLLVSCGHQQSIETQIPEYHDTVTTVLNWSDQILNWHHGRRSNGPLEGINNLLQTLRRTAHGFTNPHNYAARGLLLT